MDTWAVSRDSKYQAMRQRQNPRIRNINPRAENTLSMIHVHMICLGSNQVYFQMSSVDKEGTANTKVPWLETGLDLVYKWTVVLGEPQSEDREQREKVGTAGKNSIDCVAGHPLACLSVGGCCLL